MKTWKSLINVFLFVVVAISMVSWIDLQFNNIDMTPLRMLITYPVRLILSTGGMFLGCLGLYVNDSL